jgi:hypothetical protein
MPPFSLPYGDAICPHGVLSAARARRHPNSQERNSTARERIATLSTTPCSMSPSHQQMSTGDTSCSTARWRWPFITLVWSCRSQHYPQMMQHAPDSPAPEVKFADIGCGFGGLLIRCSPIRRVQHTSRMHCVQCSYAWRIVQHRVQPSCQLARAVPASIRLCTCSVWSPRFMHSVQRTYFHAPVQPAGLHMPCRTGVQCDVLVMADARRVSQSCAVL